MVCYFDKHRSISSKSCYLNHFFNLVKGYSNKKEFILLVIRRNVRIVRCFVTIESVCLSWLSGEVS